MPRICLEDTPKTRQALAALEFAQVLVEVGDLVVPEDLDHLIDAQHSDSETAEIVATLALSILSDYSDQVSDRKEETQSTELAA